MYHNHFSTQRTLTPMQSTPLTPTREALKSRQHTQGELSVDAVPMIVDVMGLGHHKLLELISDEIRSYRGQAIYLTNVAVGDQP